MVNDLLAGLIAGLIMGIFFQALVVVWLASLGQDAARVMQRLPASPSPAIVTCMIIVSIPFVWGIVGLVTGVFYPPVRDAFPGAGLGSRNQTFTLLILVLDLMMSVHFVLQPRRAFAVRLLAHLGFAAIFGWLLPLLIT